jgi:hypothetical protein
MIHLSLGCDKDHEFEAWFRNSSDFEAQVKRRIVNCPVCGSTNIAKSLMAPRISGTRKSDKTENLAIPDPDATKVRELMKAVRDHVKANADYVGEKFADEARKIHYGEAEKRGIYGEASAEETKELKEEGVEVFPLPVLPDDRN